MASIVFVGTYEPIKCGIADYTQYLTRVSPAGKWGVLSFDLRGYGVPTSGAVADPRSVWYGIPGRTEYTASMIMSGVRHLVPRDGGAVLWFQHEFGIFADSARFVSMLRELDIPKVVTFHSLHFQSMETGSGLPNKERTFLATLLPCVDAITVFSNGVYSAVTSAFPQYRGKVYVLRHGVHSYPEVRRLSRGEAREALNDFLLHDSGLNRESKRILRREQVLLDPSAVLIGQTGFLCPSKGTEYLWSFRDDLQRLVPGHRIVALRIGSARVADQVEYAKRLRQAQDGRGRILLETWLPQEKLPLAQRAFDVNYYWPVDCTQSGVMAHALGAGAVIAGRELEGVGETLREAGQLYDGDPDCLVSKVAELLGDPEMAAVVEQNAARYANRFSWFNQARRHYEIAEGILAPVVARGRPGEPLSVDGPSLRTA